MIEALRDIARHLDVLLLVSAHRNPVGSEHQNIRSHQDGIGEQRHRDALVRVTRTAFFVSLNRGLVGVGAVHESLRGHAAENPGQLRDLRNIGLPVEKSAPGIQPESQPGCSYFQTRAMHLGRILLFDQRVIIGQKIEIAVVLAVTRLHARPDRTDVIAQMRRAGRRNAREIGFLMHTSLLQMQSPGSITRGLAVGPGL